jgi:hypothetical protein
MNFFVRVLRRGPNATAEIRSCARSALAASCQIATLQVEVVRVDQTGYAAKGLTVAGRFYTCELKRQEAGELAVCSQPSQHRSSHRQHSSHLWQQLAVGRVASGSGAHCAESTDI